MNVNYTVKTKDEVNRLVSDLLIKGDALEQPVTIDDYVTLRKREYAMKRLARQGILTDYEPVMLGGLFAYKKQLATIKVVVNPVNVLTVQTMTDNMGQPYYLVSHLWQREPRDTGKQLDNLNHLLGDEMQNMLLRLIKAPVQLDKPLLLSGTAKDLAYLA